MYPRTIKETINNLNQLLEKNSSIIYIERLGKYTKEIIGIKVELKIDGFMNFYKPERRISNAEIESAFNKALEIIHKDKTARYAIGYPEKLSDDVVYPCISLVQIILRDEPYVIAYFRSMDIKSFPADWAVLAKRTFEAFGNGRIIIIIGSLHKYIEKPLGENIGGKR